MPASLRASAKRPGRPSLEAPRDCVVFSRLTTAEYEALLALLPPRVSLSDIVRDLLAEAIFARIVPDAERKFLNGGSSSLQRPVGLLR